MDKSDVKVPADMQEAINACYKRCERIVDRFASTMDAQSAPTSIYHYTDSAGLLGILESGKVRLTDIFGLNDPSEVRHGVKHACEILSERAIAGHPAAKIFAENFKKILDGGVEASAHYFVACYSCDGDELGQWRAYGDNGKGFAIKFRGSLLEGAFQNPDNENYTGNATFKVNYNDAVLCKIHEEIVNEFLPLIAMPEGRKLHNDTINEFMKELSVALSVCVVRMAVFFKHEGYKNEQEFRFLKLRVANQPFFDLKHRAREYSLVRFTDFDWAGKYRKALQEIVIGPAADDKAAQSFVRDCLRAGGFDPETIILRRSRV